MEPERRAALHAHLHQAIRDAESNPHGGKALLRVDDARALLAVLDGAGDYHEGIDEGWKAAADQERRVWTQAIETYFDATAVMDVERYAEEIRRGIEEGCPPDGPGRQAHG